MLKLNLDTQDRLINDQTGNITNTEFGQGRVRKAYTKFSDEHAGLKTMRSSSLGRQSALVPIEKCKTVIPIKKGSVYPFIKCTQFPLILA